MYKISKNKINNNKLKYYFINTNNKKLTYKEFIGFLKAKDKEFLKTFREVLNEVANELSAYFWECVPVSSSTVNKEFEFVITKSEELNNITQNYSEFQEYIDMNFDCKVASFLSLNKNATLIIPIPKQQVNYKNLKEFVANASLEQWEELWQKVGEKMEESLLNAGDAPRWLSTSGLNVHYLHVRINNSPKHYSHEEYLKETKAQQEILARTL